MLLENTKPSTKKTSGAAGQGNMRKVKEKVKLKLREKRRRG